MKHASGTRSFTGEGSDNNSNGSGDGRWYDVLQLPRDASADTIKRTYRQLALLWHPDKGGSVKRFQSLTAAWEVLGNAERRALYDKQLQRSGSSDGLQCRRRSSGAGAAGTARIPTEGGTAAASGTGPAGAGAPAATAGEAWRGVERTSAEWAFLRRRRYTTLGEASSDTQQPTQQYQQPQQRNKRTDTFRPCDQAQKRDTEEAEASLSEGTWTTAPETATTWKGQSDDVSAAAGTKRTTAATARQPFASTASHASEKCVKAQVAGDNDQPLSARLRSSHQQHQQKQEHCATTAGRSCLDGRRLPVGEKIAVQPTGHPDDNFTAFQSSNSRTRINSTPHAQGLTGRSDCGASTPAGATLPSSNRGPARDFSSTFSSSKSTAVPSSTSVAATDINAHTAAAGARGAVVSNSRRWADGSRSSGSLIQLEIGLKKVIGEEDVLEKSQFSASTSLHDKLQRLGVKQLKHLLSVLSIPHSFCIEKQELLDALSQAFPDVKVDASHSNRQTASSNGDEVLHTQGAHRGIKFDSHRHLNSGKGEQRSTDLQEGSEEKSQDKERGSGDRDQGSSHSSSDRSGFLKFNFPSALVSDASADSSTASGGVSTNSTDSKWDVRSVATAAAAARRRYLQQRLPGAHPSGATSAARASSGSTRSVAFASLERVCFSGASACPIIGEHNSTSSREAISEVLYQTSPTALRVLQGEVRIKLITMGEEGTGKSCIIKRYCEGRFVARNAATVGLDYGVKVVKVKQLPKQQQHQALKEKQHHNKLQIYQAGKQQPAGQQQQEEETVPVRVNFFDFSGKREFKEVRKEFYPYTDGVLLVYDISRRETFLQLKHWIEEAPNLLQYRHSTPQQQIAKQKSGSFYTKHGSLGTAQAHTPIVMLLGNKADMEREVQTAEGEAFAQDYGMLFFETSASSGHNIETALETLFEAAAGRVHAFRNLLSGQVYGLKEVTPSVKNCGAAAAANGERHAPAAVQLSSP